MFSFLANFMVSVRADIWFPWLNAVAALTLFSRKVSVTNPCVRFL